jgi:hypothetical protein
VVLHDSRKMKHIVPGFVQTLNLTSWPTSSGNKIEFVEIHINRESSNAGENGLSAKPVPLLAHIDRSRWVVSFWIHNSIPRQSVKPIFSLSRIVEDWKS